MTDIVYGSTDPLYFKLTKNGVGVNPTLVAADFRLSKDDAGGIALNSIPVAVDAINMRGVFKWTPITTETQAKTIVVNCKDAAGDEFDENMLVWYTGGSAPAFHNG